jgi:thiol-disulfide isomerase/thioredoxin
VVSGRRTRLLWGVVAAVLVLLVAWWAGWLPKTALTESAGSGSGGVSQSAVGLTLYDPSERQPMPNVHGTTLDGRSLSLADLQGHVVVINVWGSWCSPCRQEAPILARVARETRSAGVRFVGIDVRDNVAAAKAFATNFQIPYPSLFDGSGSLLLAFSGIVPVSAVPSTVIVNQHGAVAARFIGKVDYTSLTGVLTDLLAEHQPNPKPTGH